MIETNTSVVYDEQQWAEVEQRIQQQFGQKPSLQTLIFLVGHRELGKFKVKFSKEEKQDLMHVGVCALLEKAGYYEFLGVDQDGWPHYELVRNMPPLQGKEQDNLLKKQIIEYFKTL